MSRLVDFVLEQGNIRVVLEDIPTQAKQLSIMEEKIIERGFQPTYVDIIKYMRVLTFLQENEEASKKEISKIPSLSKAFKTEIKKYYQSPLTELCNYGLIEMAGKSRRYTSYRLTKIGEKAIEDYVESKGAPMLGTNFNREGLWLLPFEAYSSI